MTAERSKKPRPKIPPVTAEKALELVKLADKAMLIAGHCTYST